MTDMDASIEWLEAIRPAAFELTAADWRLLEELPAKLPGGQRWCGARGQPDGAARSAMLRRTRTELASFGYTGLTLPVADGGRDRPAVLQALAQFVCGYRDLDLRDATGPGHGALALDLVEPDRRRYWIDRLLDGAIVGIAVSERHGGSRFREMTTRARRAGDSRTWILDGEKTWVSRLTESAGFVIFFRDPDDAISAALVDSDRSGLLVEPSAPAGLTGWSWGTLSLCGVLIDPAIDLVAGPGRGREVFEWHFTRFRPLVAATALGSAVSVLTTVADALAAKRRLDLIGRIRDNAYIAVANAFAELSARLLATIHTVRLAEADAPQARLWAMTGKADAVGAAIASVTELLPLVGAGGFRASSRLIKVRDDLTAFGYADGIQDAMYRSGGRLVVGV